MKVKIYQLNKDVDYEFSSWERAQSKFDISDYEVVYEYEENYDPRYDSTYQTLEGVFYKFNQGRPDDFKGHSLSTSDVVALGDRLYYCDSFGWERIYRYEYE